MLVLSRRTDQQILFPNLDIKLQILQVQGKVVKLGIDAPPEIPIIRPEIYSPAELGEMQNRSEAQIDRHQLRNRLNAINLGLRLFQKQTELELEDQAQLTMQRVVEELQKLDQEIGTARTRVQIASQKKKLRLLVVEDDDNERELLAGLLRLHCFEVIAVSNGCEAMDYLSQQEAPDYVLLDMKMPQMDGPAIIRQIRADDRLANLKVFAVSGTSPQELGLQDGYNGWFPKPLDPERLIQAMTQGTGYAQTSL